MLTTTKDFAQALHGVEYQSGVLHQRDDICAQAKTLGIVIVYGESDDLMEFRGAVYDAVGAYDGTTAYMTKDGLLRNECESLDCPHFAKLQEKATPIKAIWHEEGETNWTFETAIPHETFDIMEDGEFFCRGIVFRLEDVPGEAA